MLLKDGSRVDDPRLDRVPSGHTKHLDKWPLTVATLPAERRGMPSGFNWYSNFDKPRSILVRGRRYWAIGDGDLGNVRGGHCTCLVADGVQDPAAWWLYYNQRNEGRCVEFGTLRALSLLNRVRYDITSRWHYFEMQRRDFWPGGAYAGAQPFYEGTSVDAGMQVVCNFGAIPARRGGRPISLDEAPIMVRSDHGIAAYRWALTWQIVREAMRVPDYLPGVPMLNSWGTGYPHRVLLLDAAGERVLKEDGEFALITDR